MPPSPTNLKSLTALSIYKPPVSIVIQTCKYSLVPEIGPWLSQLLYRHLKLPDFDAITNVPADPRRLSQRGFHLPELLAQEISSLTNKPYLPLLQKLHSTPAQATLNLQHRRQLEAAAFGLHPRADPSFLSLNYPRILLVDDVVTTGTTLSLCAQVLLASGWQTVDGLAVAHGQ